MVEKWLRSSSELITIHSLNCFSLPDLFLSLFLWYHFAIFQSLPIVLIALLCLSNIRDIPTCPCPWLPGSILPLLNNSFSLFMCVHAKSLQSCLTVTLWTVTPQAPLSLVYSRQESWNGMPCPPPGHLPNPGIKPVSLMSPTLAGKSFTTGVTGKPQSLHIFAQILF